MRILHTSDWHIGRALYGKKRYEEFVAFFAWLTEQIIIQEIDILIVAGDIFDTGTPSNKAQKLYYQFLHDLSSTNCRHIVIIGGNHDSPSLLDAPKELLKAFQVHVIGSAAENVADEVLLLKDHDGNPELIVCAVPYLRDRDIRSSVEGENRETKDRKLIDGITGHYRQVCSHAASLQKQYSEIQLPIIATGHLFAAGGSKVEGDGVRDLYVGSLAHVHASNFPDEIDYLALGHLHSSQTVGTNPRFRYCGAPLPMGFNEAHKDKVVLLVELMESAPQVTELTVPRWQKLESISGDMELILSRLDELKTTGESCWVEIIYQGTEHISGLQDQVREAVMDSEIEVLRIINNRLKDQVLQRQAPTETLEEMSEEDVFHRCLQLQQLPEDQSARLVELFHQTVQELHEEDLRDQ